MAKFLLISVVLISGLLTAGYWFLKSNNLAKNANLCQQLDRWTSLSLTDGEGGVVQIARQSDSQDVTYSIDKSDVGSGRKSIPLSEVAPLLSQIEKLKVGAEEALPSDAVPEIDLIVRKGGEEVCRLEVVWSPSTDRSFLKTRGSSYGAPSDFLAVLKGYFQPL